MATLVLSLLSAQLSTAMGQACRGSWITVNSPPTPQPPVKPGKDFLIAIRQTDEWTDRQMVERLGRAGHVSLLSSLLLSDAIGLLPGSCGQSSGRCSEALLALLWGASESLRGGI